MSNIDQPIDASRGPGYAAVVKVPAIGVYFWIVKILTTGMGEATSDYATDKFGWPVAAGLAGAGLVAALVLQMRARRYVTWVYWLAVVMVSVFGTMAADGVYALFGWPFWATTSLYAAVLAAVFVTWYATEKTLSIHAITTRRREAFYWATVLATFALGTAAGDWTATSLGLGYLVAGLMFVVIIAVPAVAHRRFGMGAVPAFWFAYVITRPLGASFADWLAAPRWDHGLDIGTGPVSLTAIIVIVALLGYLARTGRDVPANLPAPPAEKVTGPSPSGGAVTPADDLI